MFVALVVQRLDRLDGRLKGLDVLALHGLAQRAHGLVCNNHVFWVCCARFERRVSEGDSHAGEHAKTVGSS